MKKITLLTSWDIGRLEWILGGWFSITILSWICFIIYGYPILDSLHEVVSAMTNSGFTMGIANKSLSGFLKGVLIINMIFGKFTVLTLVGWYLLHHKKC